MQPSPQDSPDRHPIGPEGDIILRPPPAPAVTPSLRVGPLLLRVDAGVLVVEDAPGSARLPLDAARTLLERYGRPLDEDVPPPAGGLPLDGASSLATLSYRSPVDVIANDHVLLCLGDQRPPLAVPTPRFVAALRALARAAMSRR